jgi:hypothetical protein
LKQQHRRPVNIMAPSNSSADLKALNDLITSTQAILSQFKATLADNSSNTAAEQKPIANPPNPLDIFSDAARLLKAHVTKVSLLVLNKPFTPTAVTKVLRELSTTCLPALIAGVQICSQEKRTYGSLLGREAAARTRRVFVELEALLLEVRSVAAGSSSGNGRDSLSTTGVVWESCDSLAELKVLGTGGLAVQKAEELRETVRDAAEELQEWADGGDLETEGQDALFDSGDEGVEGDDNDSLNGIFNAANSLPADRVELKELVGKAVEKLKKVEILYKALVKRRLKTYKGIAAAEEGKKSSAEYLDEVMDGLKALPDSIDDMASTFYDLEDDAAKTALDECLEKAREIAVLARLNYDGEEDEFSTWSQKWIDAVVGGRC